MAAAKAPPIDDAALVETFAGDTFDRDQWRLATPKPEVATVTIESGAVRIVAPPAAAPRPQVRNVAAFRIEGDFDVSVDYRLARPLPDPISEYINVELILLGADGNLHLSRTNHKGAGNGIVSFYQPPSGSEKKSHWKHTPAPAKAGTLRIIRTGDVATFWHKPEGSADFGRIAEVAYGPGEIKQMVAAVSIATPTTQPVDVSFDNLRVKTQSEL